MRSIPYLASLDTPAHEAAGGYGSSEEFRAQQKKGYLRLLHLIGITIKISWSAIEYAELGKAKANVLSDKY